MLPQEEGVKLVKTRRYSMGCYLNTPLNEPSFLCRGARLATSSGDGTVKIWDFSKAECVLTFADHTHAVWGCSWHSCGDFLASCSMDSTSKVWDVNRYSSVRCMFSV